MNYALTDNENVDPVMAAWSLRCSGFRPFDVAQDMVPNSELGTRAVSGSESSIRSP